MEGLLLMQYMYAVTGNVIVSWMMLGFLSFVAFLTIAATFPASFNSALLISPAKIEIFSRT